MGQAKTAYLVPAAAAIPVPVTVIRWGPVGSGSSMDRVAVKVPAVGGLKVMLKVHDDCGGRLLPQVFVWLK